MKLPRNLSGRRLVRVLEKNWGYRTLHQTGSHVILQTEEPSRHRISVPAHKPLRIGTLNSILRSVAAHKNVQREDLLRSIED